MGYKIKFIAIYIIFLIPILFYKLFTEGFEPMIIFFIWTIVITIVFLIHLTAPIISIDKIIINSNSNKVYSQWIIWLIITSIPFLLFIYMIYLFYDCGSMGCVSGIFFLITLIPALIVGFVSLFFVK
jgi:hypothetical protein